MPRPAAFEDAEAMWKHARPTLVIVATPSNTHASFLNMFLTSKTHVLVEKPVAWTGAPTDDAAEFARAFHEAGLHLAVHAQWPYTLPTYRALHPSVDPASASTFEMRLAPRAGGLQGVVDSLSHPLSLLAAVRPDDQASLADIQVSAPSTTRTDVRFRYEAAGQGIAAHVRLEPVEAAPRPAAYAFDGVFAHRVIDMPSYAMALQDEGDQRIPLPDPSRLLVGSLLDRVATGPPDAVDPALVPGMRHLGAIWQAAKAVEFPPSA